MGICYDLWLLCVKAACRRHTYIADMMLKACHVTRERAAFIARMEGDDPRLEGWEGLYRSELSRYKRSPMDGVRRNG